MNRRQFSYHGLGGDKANMDMVGGSYKIFTYIFLIFIILYVKYIIFQKIKNILF